ncbi:MAG: 3-hydroxybenzoate 6-monooxygenase [Betaproteobacteria bacterium]|nr:MAG: 3-hydroxybenzoate 6-monooxygenase [Betaproteobacteria bacterium]
MGVSDHRDSKAVAIAGGGIGGLAAALALAIKGFRVIVLEQAHEFGELGAGIQLAPNAWSALDALGVGELVKRDAVFIERLLMMDGISGERIIDIPLDERFRKRYRNPYAVTHRADIHRALLDACIARSSLVELRTHSKVTRFDLEHDGVEVTLDGRASIHAAALIGADGWRSAVREQIVGDGDPPASGHMCYRAVLSVDDMPADLRWPAATLWAAPNTHIVHYPLRGWKLFNLVATVVRDQAGLGHNEEALPGEVLPLFAKNCETALNLLRVPTKFRRWMLRFREPVANWSEGPVTLLGDSAHLMLQYFAQGAAMAMEDAVCLASAADACDGHFAEAFQRYQGMRLVRASRVQISSRMLGLLYHAADVSRLVRNDIYRGRSAERYYDALDWIFTAPDYVRDFGGAKSSQRRVDS